MYNKLQLHPTYNKSYMVVPERQSCAKDYGTLRTDDIEDTTLRTATLTTDNIEDRRL